VKRLSLADLYNFNMNNVDVADQLRGYYRPDGLWIKLRKWWWSIFLWAMGQSVVNGYVLYKAVCRRAKIRPMDHLDFHVAVTTAWCKTPELVLEYKKEVPQVDAAAPGQGRGTPKMSDEKHTAAIESYEAGLIRHELDFPSSKTSGCQVVGSNGPTARRAPRAPRTAMSCPSGRISVRR